MKKIFNKTLKAFSYCQQEAEHLLYEKENPLDYYSKEKSYIRRIFYFCIMVYRSFTNNRCFVRATALSYATLLALVPMLALIISISAGLLKTESGEQQITKYTSWAISFAVPQLNLLGNEKMAEEGISEDQLDKDKVVDYVNSLVNNVRGGALGITGFVSLIAVVILLLTKIEETFNDIWKVTKPRGWSVRVLYYWSIITLGPILLFVALSLLGGKISFIQKAFEHIPLLGSIIYDQVLVRSLPWVLLIILFTLLYYFMPSTKVHWDAALVGGIFTGVLWQLNSIYSVVYVSSAVSYSKMYGILAAIPILLVGLYLSWLLVLLGCQVSYTWQNRRTYIMQKLLRTVGQKDRELAAIRIMVAMGRRLDKGEKPFTNEKLSAQLQLPQSLVDDVLNRFIDAGIAVQSEQDEFVPNLSLDRLSYAHILNAVCIGRTELVQEKIPSEKILIEKYHQVFAAARKEAANITIRDILNIENETYTR